MSNAEKHTESKENIILYIKHEKETSNYAVTKDMMKYSTFLQNISESVMDCDKSNPMIIKQNQPKHLSFVMSYINKCVSTGYELNEPESPLKSVHLSVILGDEYELFSSLVEIDDFPNNIGILHEYMQVADYLGCNKLFKKLTSMCAHILMNQSIDKLNAVI